MLTRIAGGTVVDGTGAEGRVEDLLLEDGLIAGVGVEPERPPDRVVDAAGLIVAPGFIDAHSHSDMRMFGPASDENVALQGIATEVVGNCGCAPAPMGTPDDDRPLKDFLSFFDPTFLPAPVDFPAYMAAAGALKRAVNTAQLVPYNLVRAAAGGRTPAGLTARRRADAREMLRDALSAGAIGVSIGLAYPPACWATEDEVGEVLTGLDTVLAIHVRSERQGLAAAIEEACRLAERSGTRLHVSHLKAAGREQWGQLPAVIERLARTSATTDVYPYLAVLTSILTLAPGLTAWAERRTTVTRDEARAALEAEIARGRVVARDVVLAHVPGRRQLAGRSLEELGSTPAELARNVVELVASAGSGIQILRHSMAEGDLEAAVRWDRTAVGTDGYCLRPGERFTHPRVTGTFPTFLRSFALERPVLSLEEAIRRITSLPASRFGLRDRGRIRRGAAADVVAFDARTLAARSTYAAPLALSEGVRHLWVNGEAVVEEGVYRAVSAGRVL